MEKDFGLNELHTNYPEAYDALPDPYKNDSCLTFFIDVNNHLCAEDDGEQEYMFLPAHENNVDNFPLWVSIG
jgi:hypothetical protein